MPAAAPPPRLSKGRVRHKRSEVGRHMKALGSALKKYDFQFNRLKNFTKDNWRTLVRDVNRTDRMGHMLTQHRKGVVAHHQRLRALVLGDPVAAPSDPGGEGTSDPALEPASVPTEPAVPGQLQ